MPLEIEVHTVAHLKVPLNAKVERLKPGHQNQGITVELDFSGRQNKRQLDFKRQNENDRFFM